MCEIHIVDVTSSKMALGPSETESQTSCKKKSTKFRPTLLASLFVLFCLSVVIAVVITTKDYKTQQALAPIEMIPAPNMQPIDPLETIPPPESKLRSFKRAAVCSDSDICSAIGKNILAKKGSAVDSIIATMVCSGVVNQQAMGIGGGFTMTVYIKEEEKAYTIIARETAPGKATQDMFHGDFLKSNLGPLSSAIPGEVRGLWEAHKRWGRLPWESLFTPTLELCETGFPMGYAMHVGIIDVPYIKNDENLREQYYDEEKNQFRQWGDKLMPSPKLCNTLQRIAEKGGDELYNGTLAAEFLQDLQQAGSIITADDLINYQPKVLESISVPFGRDGDTLFTSPPPSSGVILINILNILSGYNFTSNSINTFDDEILTYHRILEAFKYSYAMRSKLGDDDFQDLKQLIETAISPTYGEEIRRKINETTTSNSTKTYGAEEYAQPDGGTSHMTILSEEGDAVSVTSSVNNYFGAGYTTQNTGIVMNDVMDDFSSPGITNYYGVKPSPSNFIEPGKRPLSSMAPTIIVGNDKTVRLVVGASGGTKITSSIALVTMRLLWFGQSLKEAIDAPRIHHQIFPTMNAEYEFRLSENITNALRAKGHGMSRFPYHASICAAYNNGKEIYTNADYRKGGDTDGLN